MCGRNTSDGIDHILSLSTAFPLRIPPRADSNGSPAADPSSEPPSLASFLAPYYFVCDFFLSLLARMVMMMHRIVACINELGFAYH